MGCGSSQFNNNVEPTTTQSSVNNNSAKENLMVVQTRLETTKTLPSPVPTSQNVIKSPVAFDINVGDGKTQGLIAKHPPKRLQLEPLNLPKLTADMLAEKQRIADSKREKILSRKIAKSRRSSQLRQDIEEARRLEQENLKENLEKIQGQQKIAEELRESRQQEIRRKQQEQEQKALRVRERAMSIRESLENEESLEAVIERDTDFNKDLLGDRDKEHHESRQRDDLNNIQQPSPNHVSLQMGDSDNPLDEFSRMRFRSINLK